MVGLVAAFRRLNRLPELNDAEQRAIIASLIDDSGILVAEDGGFRFACQTVQDYLTAYRIFRCRPPGLRRWWSRWMWSWWIRKYLEPRTSWLGPDTEVMLFLTALLCQKAEPAAVDQWLSRLLCDQHRDSNINFVIKLLIDKRNLISGSDIRERIIERIAPILGRDIDDGQLEDSRWKARVEQLHQLDPAMAIAKLKKIIQDPSQTAERIYDALVKLMKYSPARGAENLTILAHGIQVNKPTRAPKARYDMACKIARFENHRELSTETKRQLALSPDMGEWCVNAAIDVNLPELLREVIEPERGIPDNRRFEVLEALLRGLDRPMAVAAAERIAQTARKDDTPLQIARMIQPYDGAVALRIANESAWSTNRKIASGVRWDTVILIGEIDPAQAVLALRRLSKDRFVTGEYLVTGEYRLKAAMRIVTKYHGPITDVVDIGDDPELGRPDRIEAAKFVGERDRPISAQMYISIAETCTPEDKSRLELLREAYQLDPEPAANALVKVALNEHIPGRIRLDAVKIARPELGTERTIELYTIIAKTPDSDTTRAAVREVVNLTATREAAPHGTRALMDLARPVQPITVHLEAAKALWAMGRRRNYRNWSRPETSGSTRPSPCQRR